MPTFLSPESPLAQATYATMLEAVESINYYNNQGLDGVAKVKAESSLGSRCWQWIIDQVA